MALTPATIAQWLAALQALLPPGQALTREPAAVLTRVLEAGAALLAQAQERLQSLREQSSDPARASDMLPDWERTLGLPDDCMAGQDLSLLDRQRIASQRLADEGGHSRAYFLELTQALGEPGCTIDEFRTTHCNGHCNQALYSEADLFTWRVKVPRAARNIRVAHCNDHCNLALQVYEPSLIECPIKERRPPETEVVFAYQ